MDFQIKTIKHQIEATKRLIASGCTQYVLQLIDLESKLDSLTAIAQPNNQEEEVPNFLEVWTYSLKGVNAYITTMEARNGKYDYGVPSTPEDKELSYRGKRHQVKFNLSTLADGNYAIKSYDPGTAKAWYRYVRIEDGQITVEAETKQQLERKLMPIPVNLPELEGSAKQIKWAEEIRLAMISRFISEGKEIHPQFFTETSAKKYIDYHVKNNR